MDALFTIDDLSKRLRVSKQVIWQLVEDGKLPKPVVVLSEPRWRKTEIKKFMAALEACNDSR